MLFLLFVLTGGVAIVRLPAKGGLIIDPLRWSDVSKLSQNGTQERSPSLSLPLSFSSLIYTCIYLYILALSSAKGGNNIYVYVYGMQWRRTHHHSSILWSSFIAPTLVAASPSPF